MTDQPALIRNVNHSFPGSSLRACSDVSLVIRRNSIHALVGENGAGKTTLGHIVSGVQIPDTGSLEINGRTVDLKKNRRGLIGGMGLIRQRSIWPSTLSVLEAAVLGRRELPGTRRDQIRLFRKTAVRWGLGDVNPLQPVAGMDAAARQRAEMVAALMFKPGFLILDEPSSAWEEGRAEEFFGLLKRLRDSGTGVLLITHRLEDIFRIADEVTVMRHGRVTGNWKVAELDHRELTRHMFGIQSAGSPQIPREKVMAEQDHAPAVLELRGAGLTIGGRTELAGINFTVSPGEIVGITGLKEEGLRYLEDLVSGNRRADSGGLYVDNRLMKGGSPGMRRAGLRYVPSDKTGRGASLSSTMTENLLLLESRRLARRGWLLPHRVRAWTDAGRKAAGITGNPNQRLEELSGGNIQKVILQRELTRRSRLLVAADPTWGLDEQSRRKVHGQIREMRKEGTAVLLLASDLDEALELSDRMGVISRGRLTEIRSTSGWNRREVAGLIAGGGR